MPVLCGFRSSVRERDREEEWNQIKSTTEMMIGELARSNPTVQIPPWDPLDDPAAAGGHSPFSAPSPTGDYLAALHRYLPSNEPDPLEQDPELLDESVCDHFRMYVFKVRRCSRGRSHDWTECPYAHPGEKARRRDPRRFQYSGTACPDFRKGVCKKGDSCEFAHGVFECWLHPDRYRTQPCKDGPNCRRRVCFFAHLPDQLRVLPQQQSPRSVDSDYGSAGRLFHESHHQTKPAPFSPTSILTSPPISPPSDSPPMSPNGPYSVNEIVSSMRGLNFGNSKLSPRAHFSAAPGFGPARCSTLRPGSYTNSFMPSSVPSRRGLGGVDLWESPFKEEPAMERVESGRGIRAQMYAKLSKENSLNRVDAPVSGPDLGWVSELVM